MADSPIEPGERGDYPLGMEARVAVLEQIAQDTRAALDRLERAMLAGFDRLERRMDGIDRRMDRIETGQRADFRWLLGIMLGGFAGLLGVMSHGFHWL